MYTFLFVLMLTGSFAHSKITRGESASFIEYIGAYCFAIIGQVSSFMDFYNQEDVSAYFIFSFLFFLLFTRWLLILLLSHFPALEEAEPKL